MKCIAVLAVLIAVAYGRPESPASLAAGPGPIPPPAKLVCQANGKNLGPDNAVVAEIQKCMQSDRFGDGEGKLHKNCASYCIHKAMGLLNKDSSPFNAEMYDSWAAGAFPDNQVSAAQKHFRNCYETFGAHVDLNDATCTQQAAYNACLWELQPKTACPARA